jgi:DNA-directed RNA polymerase specialized sigma24 family protein
MPGPRRRNPFLGTTMTRESGSDDDLTRRATAGDPHALAELFDRHRDRLRRMVALRLDHRLQGRVDPSDVLQEARLDVLHRAAEYAADPRMPPFLWLRFLTGQRLLALHRHHQGDRSGPFSIEARMTARARRVERPRVMGRRDRLSGARRARPEPGDASA